MTISFIVPVYNTGAYLKKCINSIVSQMDNSRLCEIIIVNDGSTDDSALEIERLSELRDYIKVINQPNKGLGAARNAGLEIAQGKYIFFLDSDDYVLDNSLENLFEKAEESSCDIIGFDGATIEAGLAKEFGRDIKLYNKVMSGADFMVNNNLSGGIWYLFSLSFLKEHKLLMPEGIYHEDELFIPKAFTIAEQIVFVNIVAYGYMQRGNSITKQEDKVFQQRKIDDTIYVIKELISIKSDEHLSELQLQGLNRKVNLLATDLIINLLRFGMDRDSIDKAVAQLRKRHLFPLNKVGSSWKHGLFRTLFRNESSIALGTKLPFRKSLLAT